MMLALDSIGRWLSLLGLLLLVGAALSPATADDDKPAKVWVYVGTLASKNGKGIYRFDMDPATGKLSNRAVAVDTETPWYLAVHPNQRFLYSVGDPGGKKGGPVNAFAIDPQTGALQLLNKQLSGGNGPCQLVVDPLGKNVLVANYDGGSVCALPIGADGKLGEATGFAQHQGASINKARQEGPHAHSINVDKGNRYAVAADLGTDKLLIYKLDPAKGTLTPNDPPAVDIAAGSGPRHFAFHPDGKHAYVINELANTVTALDFDADKGALKAIKSYATLPEGAKGAAAEIVVHPSGKFLYGSNRGHNSIVIFRIDTETGALTLVGHQTKDIKLPRNFDIDPTGNWLLVGNRGSSNIAVFRIDLKTGALAPTDILADVPQPQCLRFVSVKK